MLPLVGSNQTVAGHGCLHGACLRHSGTVDTHDLPRIHPHCTHANKCHCESAGSVGQPLPSGRGQLHMYSRTSAPRSSLDLCMQVTLLAGVIVRTQPSHSLCVTQYTPSTTPRMYTTCARSTTTPNPQALDRRFSAEIRGVSLGFMRTYKTYLSEKQEQDGFLFLPYDSGICGC